MHPLEKKTISFIKEKQLFVTGETVVVGVSGGPDSVALLHVLARLVAQLKINLLAAYVDHGLRPDESGDEIKLVSEVSKLLAVGFTYKAVDVKGFVKSQKISVEDAARQLRYQYFDEVAKKYDATKIAVAHNADDQAEELLLRLIRGTGRKGLAGMDAIRDGQIIRPFLKITKHQILEYLKERDIAYCLDSSNKERIYLRNKVRLDLLPYLAEHFNPGIKNVLRQNAAIFEDEENLLESLTEEAYEEDAEGSAPISLRLGMFMRRNVAIQRRIVEKILLAMGTKPGFRQIEQVLHLAGHGTDSNQIHLNDGLRGVIKEDKIIFSYPQGKIAKRGNLQPEELVPFNVEIKTPGTYRLDDNHKVEVTILDEIPSDSAILDPKSDYLDMSAITFPLRVRTVQPGDRFHPLGAPGKKKVNDFFTDIKLPKHKRGRVPILVVAGAVAALLGIRVDNRFRVGGKTRQLIKVTVLNDKAGS